MLYEVITEFGLLLRGHADTRVLDREAQHDRIAQVLFQPGGDDDP